MVGCKLTKGELTYCGRGGRLLVKTRLHHIGLHVCDLELVRTVTGAGHSHSVRRALIVELEVNGVHGFGEVPVLASPNYSHEWFSGTYSLLKDLLLPHLASVDTFGFGTLDWLRGNGGARIGVETALVDLLAKLEGIGSTAFLGTLVGSDSYLPHKPIPFGVAVGVTSGWQNAESEMFELLEKGASRIKFKVNRDSLTHFDLTNFTNLKCQVIFDLNGSLRSSDLSLLSELDPAILVEEPSYGLGLFEYQRFAQSQANAILLDESADRLSQGSDIPQLMAGLGMVVKPFRFGSVLRLHQALEILHANAISCYLGGMFETSVGRRFLLSLSSHPCFDLVGDMAPSSWYYKDDIGNPLEVASGDKSLVGDFKFGSDVLQLENHQCNDACFVVKVD